LHSAGGDATNRQYLQAARGKAHAAAQDRTVYHLQRHSSLLKEVLSSLRRIGPDEQAVSRRFCIWREDLEQDYLL
jgi:hypothetical protein